MEGESLVRTRTGIGNGQGLAAGTMSLSAVKLGGNRHD